MELPKRKRLRLEEYDYGEQGYYFITLCTYKRQRLFEIYPPIVGNDLCVVPPVQNKIIEKWIIETQRKFDNIKIEKYVIMPDHLHFIFNISERHIGRSLQDAIRFFKTMTTNEYIRYVNDNLLSAFGEKLWQKSYYDHIIRNEKDYLEICEYIDSNPAAWVEKQESINLFAEILQKKDNP